MIPKEKAKELLDRFYNYKAHQVSVETRKEVAKEHAIICVDEILNDNPNIYDSDRLNHKYWKQVKKEINNL